MHSHTGASLHMRYQLVCPEEGCLKMHRLLPALFFNFIKIPFRSLFTWRNVLYNRRAMRSSSSQCLVIELEKKALVVDIGLSPIFEMT